ADLAAQPPVQRNRMLLLVLGTGAAVGLHLGLLHLYMWRSWIAPVTFFVGSLSFAAVTYCLWRWGFPRLPAKGFAAQIAEQTLLSLLVYGCLSIVAASLGAWALGAPGLFGTATGPDQEHIITAAMRQAGVRTYALLPIVPSVLTTIITYHLVWRRMET